MCIMKCVILLLLFVSACLVDQSSAQEVIILTQSPVRIVYGSSEPLVCVAYILENGLQAEVEWTTTAMDANITNQTDVFNDPNVDIRTLTLSDVDSGYCGEYTCTETMGGNMFFDTIRVDVAPAITVHPTDQSIGVSMLLTDTVNLTCTVQGGLNNPVDIVWSGPSNVSLSNPLNIVNGLNVISTLTLTNIDYGYVGEYMCVTNYTDTSCSEKSISDPASLYIVSAPVILVPPDPDQQNLTVGSSVTYFCSFNASDFSSRLCFDPSLADFDVYWVGPNGRIPTGQRSTCDGLSVDDDVVNTTLTLLNVSSADGGWYSCVAENIDGRVNGTTLLFVDPIIDPVIYTARVNDSITITCDVQDNPFPLFRWQKEMNGFFQDLGTNGRGLQLDAKNFTIEPVIFGDEGTYRCVVSTDEFGPIASNDVTLSVSPESSVMVSPLNEIFDSENNVSLICVAQGGPNNDYNWTVTTDGVTTQGVLSPNFDLNPVRGGVYTCVVSNAAGFGSATTTVFVHLKFTLHPNDTFAEIGSRRVLVCEAESFPQPTYEWFRMTEGIRGNLSGINTSMLVFDSVLFGDEGDYYCLATSRINFTLASQLATFTVSPRGSVIIEPSTQVASFNDNVTFTCSSQGGPNNTFQWYKDSQILSNEIYPNLTLATVDSTDGGVYTCLVSNAAGNDSISSTLFIRPYLVVLPETEVTTTVASLINFTCQAEGFPHPSIEWFKRNGTEIVLIENGDFLEFDPVMFGNEGVYLCTASSSIPDLVNSTQAQAVLTVSPEGSVTVSPLNIYYSFQDNATFTCSFLGGLNNSIFWTKDGSELSGEVNPQLTLTNVSAQDGGVYACTVRNSAGNETADLTLCIVPYFTQHPTDVLSMNGSRVSFGCHAEAFPLPSYEWLRMSDEAIRADAIGRNESVLTLSPVVFGDEGSYLCEASIFNVSTFSLTATLSVFPDEVIVTALPSNEPSFNDNVNLTCTNLGGPDNSYVWLKDETIIEFENEPILALYNVESVSGGSYTCLVSNLAGNSSGNLVLYIQPYITLLPDVLVTVINGTDANFTCEADGFPLPVTTWIKYDNFQNSSLNVSTGNDLVFEPVLFGDEGYYVCVASSIRFDGKALVDDVSSPLSELAVSPFPSVRISTHNETYFLGDNTTLSCSSLGGPNNTYLWLQDGMIVGTNPTLYVTNINASHGGTYRCLVENNAGSDFDDTNVFVHPYLVSPPDANVYTYDGANVTFECIVDGFPVPNVTWEYFEDDFEPLEDFDNLPLVLSPVGYGDEGYYRCVVSSRTPGGVVLETVISQPTLLTVSPEGSVFVTPLIIGERFDDIIFTCSSLGGPDNTYHWLKDDFELDNETNTSLTVTNISASDGGMYSCVVSNTAGNETVDSILAVRPYITLNPERDILSSVGSNVSFECEAESFPSPSYVWKRNDSSVSSGPVLRFVPVLFGDQGVYSCEAFIFLTNLTAISQSGMLTVSPEGGVSSFPPFHNGERNRTVQFICQTEGGPGNAFTWTRLLDNTVVSNSSLLEIDITGEFSGGVYMCDVINRAGNSSTQAILNVAPMATEHPTATNVTIMNSFSLSCAANGYPVPTLTWLLNGTEVTLSNDTMFFSGSGSGDFLPVQRVESTGVRSVRSTLTVSMAMTNDSGNYSCLVVSPVGEYERLMTETALVLVQDVPDPPHSIHAESVTNESMILLWEEPHDNNAPILGYQVTYHTPDFLGGDVLMVNSSAEMIFIGGLHPGTVYGFTIVAYNEISVSGSSDVGSIATLDEEPASPPLNLSAMVLSSTQVMLTWNEIPEIFRHGIITTYEIAYIPLETYGRTAGELSGSVNGSGNSTQIVVSNIQENTAYNFSVRGYTSAGPGPYGERITEITLEDVPSSPPRNIQVLPLSSTSLSVQWNEIDPLDENGIITHYEILYRPLRTFGVLIEAMYANVSENGRVLNDLEEYVEYAVSVRGYTRVGPGPYSVSVSNFTLQDVPASFPLDVQVGTVSSTEMLVKWEDVSDIDQNGVIFQYEVLYNPFYTFGGLLGQHTRNSTDSFLLLDDLEEDLDYNVSVRAYTVAGAGPYSEPVANFTLMDAPDGPPINIMVMALSSSHMMVTWDEVPEINQNGPIILYGIIYIPFDTFDGQLQQNYSSVTNGTTIELGDLEEYLEYNVSVRAYTEVGAGPYSEPVSSITFEDVPASSVQDVRVITTSSTSISVQWDEVAPIDRNGIQTQYEIRYEPLTTFDGEIQHGSELTQRRGEFELSSLQEFVEYNISVRSYTSVGPGPYSVEVANTTFEDVPSNFPQNLTVTVRSSTAILVAWLDVPEIDQNGIVIAYQILYTPSTTFNGQIPTNLTQSVPFSNMNISIPDLQEFVEYSVSVRAFTSQGPGPYSDVVTMTTDPDVPDSPPLDINATSISPNEILVTWEPLDPISRNGYIVTYDIALVQNTFNEIAQSNVTNVLASVATNQFRAIGLEEYVVYTVRVRARTSVGPGPYSNSLLERTLEDIPSESPGNLAIIATSPNSLSVSWVRPSEIAINGVLTMYSVTYSILDTSNNTQFSVNDSTLVVELTGLNNFTNYTVSVSAFSRVGKGPSAVEIGETNENVPGEAPFVTVARSNSFESILLEWTPPREEYIFGILRGFRVRHMNIDQPDAGFVNSDIVSSEDRSFIIEGLLQYTNYSVQVTAITVGEGVYSEPVIVTTDQDKPTGAPVFVEMTPQSDPRSILVTWGEVPRVSRNGIIISYDISFEPQNTYNGTIGPDTVLTNQTRSFLLQGLEENTPYNVSVRAYTIVGAGPYSPGGVVSTTEGVPSAPPTNLEEVGKSSRHMTIQWGPVPEIDQNGNIVLYSILYGAVDASKQIEIVSSSETSFNATDLIPGTVYSFRIAARTIQGIGSYSPDIFPDTLEERPGVVDNLDKVERFTSITVTWDIPQEPNGVLLLYEVMFNKTPSAEPTLEEVPILNTFFRLDGLATGENVTFRVRAYTRIGPGEFVIIHAGTRNKPPRIQNVTVIADSNRVTTVEVHWTPLTFVDAEHVMEYRLNYTMNDQYLNSKNVSVDANRNSAIVADLTDGVKYLFRVSAVARIDNDIIEGEQSVKGINSFYSVPPIEPYDPLPSTRLGTSIPFTAIIVFVVYTVVIVILWFMWRKCHTEKAPVGALEFGEQEGQHNYESLEMLRRELPRIPPTQSGRSTPRSLHMNTSYKTVRQSERHSAQQGHHDSVIEITHPDDIYDNDPFVADTGFSRYSTVPRSGSVIVSPSARQSTVIQNETSESAVSQEVEELYDPFETQLSVRRDSNPNLYSEVNVQEYEEPNRKAARSAKQGQLDTSTVITNPALENSDKEKRKMSETVAPPVETVLKSPDSEHSGDVYEDMVDTTPTLLVGQTSDNLANPAKSDSQSVDETDDQPITGEDRGSYFLFKDHYDDIMDDDFHAAVEDEDYTDMSGKVTSQ